MSRRRRLLIISCLVVLALTPIIIYAYEFGPDPGYTGAPGDNPTGCTASGCHVGAPNSSSGSVKIAASGGTVYVPGQTQQIQVTITDSAERKFGFELTARLDSNPKVMGAGTFMSTDANTQVLDCKTQGVVPFEGICPAGSTGLQWIEHTLAGFSTRANATPSFTYTFNWTPPATNVGTITMYAAGNAGTGDVSSPNNTHTYLSTLQLSPPPTVSSGGVVPVCSATSTIQPGSYVSIYGDSLATGTTVWNGDFPTTLGSTSVKINNKDAYMILSSPGQVNVQAPDDTMTGSVNVVLTNSGASSTSTVTLAALSPCFSLLDAKHVAAIILRPDGSGAYAGGAYDIVGPTGTSLGYKTVAAKAGDVLELFGVGFGPTTPAVPAGKPFAGAAPTMNAVQIKINGQNVTPAFAGLTAAGLYQFNITIPAGLPSGDQSLQATVAGVQTPTNAVISIQ